MDGTVTRSTSAFERFEGRCDGVVSQGVLTLADGRVALAKQIDQVDAAIGQSARGLCFGQSASNEVGIEIDVGRAVIVTECILDQLSKLEDKDASRSSMMRIS